jgi:hypothetical protein
MEQSIISFLKELQVRVDDQELIQLLHSHPDYPSLVSVTDVLHILGVDNTVAEFSEGDVSALPFPYLLHLKQHGLNELTLISKSADLVGNIKPEAGWSGIIIQAHGLLRPIATQIRSRFERAIKLRRVIQLLFILTCVLLMQIAWAFSSWEEVVIYIAALTGLVVGGVFLAKEFGISPKLVDDFCGGGSHHAGSTQSGCNEVLAADPIRVFGLFTLTDAVTSYFLWQVISLVIVALHIPASSEVYNSLILISFLGIPIIIFSLYQQYIVAKAWCRLCLLVDAILLIQAGIAAYIVANGLISLTNNILIPGLNLGLGLVASVCLTLLIRQAGVKQRALLDSEAALRRSKGTTSLLVNNLYQQPQVDSSDFEQELVLGSDNAAVDLIIASNLYCIPCKKEHEQVIALLSLYPNLLRVRYRLILSGNDLGRFPTTNQYLLQYWLTHIWKQPDERSRTAHLLNEWYEDRDFEHFKSSHPTDFTGDYSLSTRMATKHFQWAKQNKIMRTPSIYLNGYLLPSSYQLADLVLLIPNLAEALPQEAI